MPVYNSESFLHDSIKSITNQTYQNWELIAIDDGSKDNTYKILKSYAKKDPRIKVFRNKVNQGIGNTVNIALSKTRGNYIARQDADGISHPQRLEKQLSYLLDNPNVGILGSFMNELNLLNGTSLKRVVPITHQGIKQAMFITQTIQNPTVMINRLKIPFNQFWFNGEISPVDELDFFFRLLNRVQFANIPEFLVTYSRHTNNSSLKNIKKTFKLTFLIRFKAILVYGYRPELKEFLIHWVQSVIVFTLPNSVLYTLFQFWKNNSNLSYNLKAYLRNTFYQRVYKTLTTAF